MKKRPGQAWRPWPKGRNVELVVRTLVFAPFAFSVFGVVVVGCSAAEVDMVGADGAKRKG